MGMLVQGPGFLLDLRTMLCSCQPWHRFCPPLDLHRVPKAWVLLFSSVKVSSCDQLTKHWQKSHLIVLIPVYMIDS